MHRSAAAVAGVLRTLGVPGQVARWAAAGHPRTVFPTSFAELVRITEGTAADVGP
jgi:hypothetical protein